MVVNSNANIVQGQLTTSTTKRNVTVCTSSLSSLQILFHNVGKQKGQELGIQMIKF